MTQRNDATTAARRDASVERYIRALDAADFDTVAAVLTEAATDPVLAQLIQEVDEALHTEANLPTFNEHTRQVRLILRQTLHSAFLEPASGPPTVGDVAVRLQSEHDSGHQPLLSGDLSANQALLGQTVRLTGRLTPRTIRDLTAPFGVQASDRYWELFRRAAGELRMIRTANARYQTAARPRTPRQPRDASSLGEES